MQMPAPVKLRAGDYVMNFPVERPSDRDTARQAMKRNGCRTIRFESIGIEIPDPEADLTKAPRMRAAVTLIAHGYVARMSGDGVEEL